jgi:hypothetical protein
MKLYIDRGVADFSKMGKKLVGIAGAEPVAGFLAL